jgi:hypothetical protein
MAMFKAFKPSGMEKIARSMGYQGNMQGFQDYVSQDPMRQQQMQNYTNQAMQMARGGVARKMREGGVAAGGINPLTGTATTQAAPQQYQSALPSIQGSIPPMYGPEGTYSLTGQPSPAPNIPPAQITTMAFGEEDGQKLPELPDGKFLAKTMAVGEDDPIPNPPPTGVTKALGEDFNPGFATLAVGEDGGGGADVVMPVTEAIGEDDPNFIGNIGTLPVTGGLGQPVTINGITYNSATRAVGETTSPPPPSYRPAQQAPVPIATPPQPTTYDPLGQYRPNVDMYTETGAFKNPQIQSTHETLKGVYEKTDATPEEKSNATLDYLRNIYSGPLYNSETGVTGLGANQFTQEFAQFASAMGIEINNGLAADGPQLLNIPEGNPTLTQAGWMPQAPATQPGITDFTVQQMYAPGVPVGGETVATGIGYDPSQDIAAGTGALTGTVATPTAMALTAQAAQPTQTEANVMQAAQAAPGVSSAMNATQAAQANPNDPRAQITAAQQTTSSVGNLTAAQGNAFLINNPVQRQIQQGELISGVANAQTASQFTEQIQAAQATPSQQATVQGQLNNLMQQFQGGNTPTWAAAAMRSVTSAMAARGLSASSLAGQAMVQAAMESALPIAQADAQVQAQFEGQNLSNRQQRAMLAAQQRAQFMGQEFDQAFQSRVQNSARIGDIANMNFTAEQQVQLENSRAVNTMNLNNLSNRQAMVMAEASALAQLDTSNLSNRQQSAVQNAQNFLQIDMANLSNRQQTELFKAQQRVQSLFTDQAATNAARQFNASSQNQVDQFFASLGAQVAQFNATQQNAQAQFNTGQTNTINRFNAELNNQRDQFNAQNQLVIAQANAQWRRQIATADTAAINRANELNASAILDISKNAYDNLWNFYGDAMEWAWTSAENQIDRNNALAIAQLDASTRSAIADEQSKSAAGAAVGSLISTIASIAMFGCWIAREVYGDNDMRWFIFRTWLYHKSPRWFYKLYLTHGEKYAKFISNKPLLKWCTKQLMDLVVEGKRKKLNVQTV